MKTLIKILLLPIVIIIHLFFMIAATIAPIFPIMIFVGLYGMISTAVIYIFKKGGIKFDDEYNDVYPIDFTENRLTDGFLYFSIYIWFIPYCCFKYIKDNELIICDLK